MDSFQGRASEKTLSRHSTAYLLLSFLPTVALSQAGIVHAKIDASKTGRAISKKIDRQFLLA